jgi:hypothetical protein
MDGIGFDRITKALAATSARRQALRASVAGIVASTLGQVSQVAEARKKKHKKKKKKKGRNGAQCLDFTETCTSDAECCEANQGLAACRQTLSTKDNCAAQFPGLRCCGLDGVLCDFNQGNCECCDDLVCTLAADNKFRCQPSEP